MINVYQCVITRMALYRLGGVNEDWLKHRCELMEKLTIPAMAGQNAEYHWLLLFQMGLPEWFIDKVTKWSIIYPFIKPVLIPTKDRDWFPIATTTENAIKGYMPKDTTHVIQTRMDNDDVIADDFVSTVKEELRPYAGRKSKYLSFTHGYVWKEKLLEMYWPWNAFISVIEPINKMTTIYRDQHQRIMPPKYDVLQIENNRIWCHVRHGQNKSQDGSYGWPVETDKRFPVFS